MKYCPVLPPKLITLLDSDLLDPEAELGYFAFADTAFTDEEYRNWFKGKDNIVLDCPIMEVHYKEPGVILIPQLLNQVVKQMKPKFTIIPDAHFDRLETMRMFYRYCEVIDHPSMTGVLQGRTFPELVKCGLDMWDSGVRQLACPRISEKNGLKVVGGKPATRDEVIKAISSERDVRAWHLLGGVHPYEDARILNTEGLVWSLDTAEPINAGFNLAEMGDVTPPELLKRPAGFRDITDVTPAQRVQILNNIGAMAWWLNFPALTSTSAANMESSE